MSGHEEIERLLAIIADGVRQKMGRPQCVVRPSWRDDSTDVLLRRHTEELDELLDARERFRRMRGLLTNGGDGKAGSLHWDDYVEAMRPVFYESVDVVAFGAMLVDPLRLERIFDPLHPRRFVP